MAQGGARAEHTPWHTPETIEYGISSFSYRAYLYCGVRGVRSVPVCARDPRPVMKVL